MQDRGRSSWLFNICGKKVKTNIWISPSAVKETEQTPLLFVEMNKGLSSISKLWFKCKYLPREA